MSRHFGKKNDKNTSRIFSSGLVKTPRQRLLKIDGVDTRREHKLTAGTVSLYISYLRVCRANTLVTRTTAIRDGSEIPFAVSLLK